MNINVSLNAVITYMHGCMYVTRMSLTVGQRALGLLPLHVSGARKVPSVVMAACSSRQCGSPLLPPPLLPLISPHMPSSPLSLWPPTPHVIKITINQKPTDPHHSGTGAGRINIARRENEEGGNEEGM